MGQRLAWAWLLLLSWLCAGTALAHEVPADVRVLAYIRPEGQTLQLLLRVPLAAMREVDLPLRGAGLLDLARAEPALRQAAALWLVDNLHVYENDQALPPLGVAEVRISLASDRAFSGYAQALAHLRGARLPHDTDLPWQQQWLDLRLEAPIASAQSNFAIHPRLARLGLRVTTVVHFVPDALTQRSFELHGDPGRVQLDPRWHQAALRFVELGARHILGGADHLLFLFCLILPLRRLKPLVLMVSAFTVAHSLTLAVAAFGLGPQGLWFNPGVETLIAASIVLMALENIFGSTLRRRWLAAFAFGLVHGFGLAAGLGESWQLAGAHLVTALLAFNLGVELGQIGVLLLSLPLLALLWRVVPQRLGLIVLSALAAHSAWHWMSERYAAWSAHPWPRWDVADAASALRWALAALLLAGALWWLDGRAARWLGADAPTPPKPDRA